MAVCDGFGSLGVANRAMVVTSHLRVLTDARIETAVAGKLLGTGANAALMRCSTLCGLGRNFEVNEIAADESERVLASGDDGCTAQDARHDGVGVLWSASEPPPAQAVSIAWRKWHV